MNKVVDVLTVDLSIFGQTHLSSRRFFVFTIKVVVTHG
jgi:hypothetical protein